jgi:hypothetical protein
VDKLELIIDTYFHLPMFPNRFKIVFGGGGYGVIFLSFSATYKINPPKMDTMFRPRTMHALRSDLNQILLVLHHLLRKGQLKQKGCEISPTHYNIFIIWERGVFH